MDYVKYFTNDIFCREDFAALCRERGVEACAVDGGVIINREQYNAIGAARMPMWMWQNRKFINSQFHVREATQDEIALCKTTK